jgi:hypothetical protein
VGRMWVTIVSFDLAERTIHAAAAVPAPLVATEERIRRAL